MSCRRIALGFLAALAAGCAPAGSREAAEPGRLRVICTTGMIADLTRGVAGDHADVAALMGPGVDPHLYKVTIRDIGRLGGADLILFNGLHLEGKMGDVLDRLARRVPTHAIAERLPERRLLELEPGVHDPHIWFDTGLWAEGVAVVRDAFCEADPAHAAEYRANADRLYDELRALDAEVRAELATIPERGRVLVTAHDAFHYFGRAYDVEVRAIQGLSTDSEASVKQVNELVQFLVDRGIKSVFVESTISNQNIAALVEGCRAVGHEVSIGGELFSDAMGAPGTEEGTYAGMVRHNVRTIVSALR